MKRGAVKTRRADADFRRRLGQSVAARREKIEMAGIGNEVILGRGRQRVPHDVGVPFVGSDLVVLGARQSCTGAVTFSSPTLLNASPSAGAATTAALTRGS